MWHLITVSKKKDTKLTLKAVRIEEIFAFLVAFYSALSAPNTLGGTILNSRSSWKDNPKDIVFDKEIPFLKEEVNMG